MATRLVRGSTADRFSLLSIAHGTSLDSYSSHINLSCFFIKIITETFQFVGITTCFHLCCFCSLLTFLLLETYLALYFLFEVVVFSLLLCLSIILLDFFTIYSIFFLLFHSIIYNKIDLSIVAIYSIVRFRHINPYDNNVYYKSQFL